MYNTKNYMEQGGNKLVIGGTLEIKPEATVIGLVGGNTQCEYQPDSEATTIAALKDDFNALLSKLRAAGLMAGATDDSDMASEM